MQTIEMFEVITLSQPMDYQSLEILKEAYSKLGREGDVITTSKRIAEAYVHLGQLSSAILEYESVLQRAPEDPDVKRALAEIEHKANSFSTPAQNQPETDFAEKKSAAAALRQVAANGHPPVQEVDDGREQMQKLFVEAKLIAANDFDLYWPTPAAADKLRVPVEPFIQVLSDRQVVPLEKSLKLLSEKTRLGFLPVEKYDVDVDFTRGFPRETCMRWCVLPFDRMSKTTFIATANPFNKQALREMEAHTKGRILWYLAAPVELVRIVKKLYR